MCLQCPAFAVHLQRCITASPIPMLQTMSRQNRQRGSRLSLRHAQDGAAGSSRQRRPPLRWRSPWSQSLQQWKRLHQPSLQLGLCVEAGRSGQQPRSPPRRWLLHSRVLSQRRCLSHLPGPCGVAGVSSRKRSSKSQATMWRQSSLQGPLRAARALAASNQWRMLLRTQTLRLLLSRRWAARRAVGAAPRA